MENKLCLVFNDGTLNIQAQYFINWKRHTEQ